MKILTGFSPRPVAEAPKAFGLGEDSEARLRQVLGAPGHLESSLGSSHDAG